MKYIKPADMPEPLFNAIVRNDNSRKPDPKVRRVSQLIAPVYQWLLYQKHYEDIEVNAAQHIFSTIGTIGHNMFETDDPDYLSEYSMEKEINGIKITGTCDLIHKPSKTLYDYKLSTFYKRDGDSKWTEQLNIYAYLFDGEIENIRICLIMRDWSKTRALQNSLEEYPYKTIYVEKIDNIETLINERVDAHKKGMELGINDCPICTPEERWNTGEKWAIYKNKNKSKAKNPRAFKLFDNQKSAELFLKDTAESKDEYTMEYRAGSDMRCTDYCDVNKYCKYYCSKYKDLL